MKEPIFSPMASPQLGASFYNPINYNRSQFIQVSTTSNMLSQISISLAKLQMDEISSLTLLILCIVFIFSLGLLITKFISDILDENLEIDVRLSVTPMAGMIGTILFAFPLFLSGPLLGKKIPCGLIIYVLSLLILGTVLRKFIKSNDLKSQLNSPLFILTILFLGFLSLRLIFIKDLLLPPYSDSVEHYHIIQDLLHSEAQPLAFYKITRIFTRYYHFGFHTLAAWFSTLTRTPVQDTMLVLGQLIQAIIPISLFFPIKAITKNNTAGLMTVLMAGICWKMPGFASNWGKYPALTGLAIFPFTPGVLYLAGTTRHSRNKSVLIVIALVGGFITALSHSRTIILSMFLFSSWWIAGRLINFTLGWKQISLAFSLLAIFWTGSQIYQDVSLVNNFIPYLRDGFLPTFFVIILLPFGFRFHPRLYYSQLLFLFLILSAALWPLPIPNRQLENLYLFDRPFAQLILFLPLSVLGGLGFAGFFEFFRYYLPANSNNVVKRHVPVLINLSTSAILIINAILFYDYSPSPCCQLAWEDDLSAYEWIENNLPKSSNILIASSMTPSRRYGVDGGIWITPLIGFNTVMKLNTLHLDSPSVLKQLCDEQITHIYTGRTNARFTLDQIYSHRDWYKNIFSSPGANVYEIVGCE